MANVIDLDSGSPAPPLAGPLQQAALVAAAGGAAAAGGGDSSSSSVPAATRTLAQQTLITRQASRPRTFQITW